LRERGDSAVLFFNAFLCHEFFESRVRLASLRHTEFGGRYQRASPIGGCAQNNLAGHSYPVFDFHNLGMGSALGSGISAAHVHSWHGRLSMRAGKDV
jgi:hypothetical protein